LPVTPVTFIATATAGSPADINKVNNGADGQSGVVTTTLPIPYTVLITDADGNPVPGVTVNFNIDAQPSGGAQGSLSVSSGAITDINGRAASLLTLGERIGGFTISATAQITGSPSVTFNAQANADVALTIAAFSGDGQTGPIGTQLNNDFVVAVTDQYTNPVGGQSVSFTITGAVNGATLSTPTTLATSANGRAAARLTLGTLVGSYTVDATAALAGSPVTFTATASSGAIDPVLSTVSANPTNLPADGIAASIITVTLRDSGSNPIIGTKVSLISGRSASDQITIIDDTTDSNGQMTGTVKSTSSGTAPIIAIGDPLGANVTLDQPANITFFVVSTAFSVQIDPFYDTTNSAVVVTTSLLQNGSLFTSQTLTLDSLIISDSSGADLSGNLNGAGNTTTDTQNTIFHTVWDPAGALLVTETYSIIAKIKYSNVTYSGVKAFNVDQLGIIKTDVDNLNVRAVNIQSEATTALGKVDGVVTDLGALDTDVVTPLIDAQTDYRAITLSTLSSMSSQVGAVLEDTEKSLPDLLADEITAQLAKGIQSEIVTRSMTVETGETVPVRFRSASRLSPTITVYDPNDVPKITGVVMTEVGKTGIYEHEVTFNTAWGTGSFMALVQEPLKESIDSIILTVVDKSAASSSTAEASSAVTLDTLYSRMNGIDNEVGNLLKNIDIVEENTMGVDVDLDELVKQLKSGGAITEKMSDLDIQRLVGHLNSVSSNIGVGGEAGDFKTVLGKLNNIEAALAHMGTDGATAKAFNQNATQKAGNITEFIGLITKELEEEGNVDDLEEKMGILEGYLLELKEAVSEIPVAMTSNSVTDSVKNTLDELSAIAAGNESLGELLRLVEHGPPAAGDGSGARGIGGLTPQEILEMRNDVNALKSLMLEIKVLLDHEVNQPVVHGWLEGE
jgi:hypothetical protein